MAWLALTGWPHFWKEIPPYHCGPRKPHPWAGQPASTRWTSPNSSTRWKACTPESVRQRTVYPWPNLEQWRDRVHDGAKAYKDSCRNSNQAGGGNCLCWTRSTSHGLLRSKRHRKQCSTDVRFPQGELSWSLCEWCPYRIDRTSPPFRVDDIWGFPDVHVSIGVLQYAKDNGIVMLSFPPHCSHELQPLDRTVYGPLKRYYNAACDGLIVSNKGRTMSIYDIPAMVGIAFSRAMTPDNILSGFKVSDVLPFDWDIFPDSEFLPSDVTDRPDPRSTDAAVPAINEVLPTGDDPSVVDALPSGDEHVTSGAIAPIDHTPLHTEASTSAIDAIQTTPCHAKSSCTSLSPIPSTSGYVQAVTPEDVRPFTKAAPRKATYVDRNIGRSRVFTDTPEKAEIEANYAKRHAGNGKERGKERERELPTARALALDVSQKGNTDTEDDDVWPCLVCCEPFSNSRSGEKVDPVHCM